MFCLSHFYSYQITLYCTKAFLMKIEFQNNISLSDYTSIGLGGKAKLFLKCKSANEIISALVYAKENNLKVQVLSGGSNIIFPDIGYYGFIIKNELKGIEFAEKGNFVFVKSGAGENWDDFVKLIINKGLSGIECLSGIPGSVGATPIQNVGAYGQEVKDTIVSLNAIDRDSLNNVSFQNEDCNFGYRQSRFKLKDKDKFIITDVTFRFIKDKQPEIKYTELQKYLDSSINLSETKDLKQNLNQIRKAVLDLRKKKSMVIDKSDPNSKSCGSFFMNPVLNEKTFELFKSKFNSFEESFPFYKTGNDYKIPAAWLVEKSGFEKGYKRGGVGISENHSLALININGTTEELLNLADEIEKKVYEKFGIKLFKEPVIIS